MDEQKEPTETTEQTEAPTGAFAGMDFEEPDEQELYGFAEEGEEEECEDCEEEEVDEEDEYEYYDPDKPEVTNDDEEYEEDGVFDEVTTDVTPQQQTEEPVQEPEQQQQQPQYQQNQQQCRPIVCERSACVHHVLHLSSKNRQCYESRRRMQHRWQHREQERTTRTTRTTSTTRPTNRARRDCHGVVHTLFGGPSCLFPNIGIHLEARHLPVVVCDAVGKDTQAWWWRWWQ